MKRCPAVKPLVSSHEGSLKQQTVRLVRSILKKAAPRFELGIKDLQSSALPLGYAVNLFFISFIEIKNLL